MASGGDSGDGNRSQRPPKDMKDLLKLCYEQADPDHPNENVNFQSMPEERREWLENALIDMTVNPVVEMKKAIDMIIKSESDIDDKIQAVESLMEWSEQADYAIDFHKIGGFEIFPVCMGCEEAELRWQCLALIATVAQNNPYCQQAIVEHKLLPTLLHILDTDTDPTVKTKALYAVSCTIRDNQTCLDMFIELDGFSYIMRALQTDVEKLKIKGAFLLSAVCVDNDKSKDILCDMGMVEQLLGLLSEEHTTFHEHLLSALLTIIRNHSRSLQECRRPELNIQTVLQQKAQDLKGLDQYKEECDYCLELMALTTPEDTEQDLER